MGKATLIILILCFSSIAIDAQERSNNSFMERKFHAPISTQNKDSLKAYFEAGFSYQYGGETKLPFIPKFYLVRKHNLKFVKPYYGIEFGILPIIPIVYMGSIAGVIGLEKNRFNVETSFSYFRYDSFELSGDNESNLRATDGPTTQRAINLKVGYQIRKIRIKVGRTFVLGEQTPKGSERIGLLDFGKIGSQNWGIELQVSIGKW